MLTRLAAVTCAGILAGTLLAGASWGRGAADDPLCGLAVTASMTLTGDVRCESMPGLVVGASGITIDLHGHTIDGTGSGQTGIQNSGFDGVKIVNGKVLGFRFGIVIENDADKNVVDGITVRANELDGLIVATASDQLTLKNVRAIRNGADGISLTDSAGHKVSGVYATGNQASGIELINAAGASVSASTVTQNPQFGILAYGSFGGLSISKVVAAANRGSNDGAGVYVFGNAADGARLQDVTATGNNQGIIVADGDGAVLQRVTVSGNRGTGLGLGFGADDVRVTQATATGNVEWGISVCGDCDRASILKSAAVGNGEDGISLGNGSALIRASTADANNGTGIYAASAASDGGGNVARANYVDCVNVQCG